MVCASGCVVQGFGHGHWPAQSQLVGEHQPSFAQRGPAQFGFLIDGELRMMETALGLGAKCREVTAIDFGYVCHVTKLPGKLKNPAGNPHLLFL
jgi:hypothetical protein